MGVHAMTGTERHGSEPTLDERALEVALDRLLGGAVAGVMKATILQKARQAGTTNPDVLLQEIENLNPWLGELLRDAATKRRGADVRESRTQRSTNARKGEK